MSGIASVVGLSLNEIRKRVSQFAHDYKDASRERSESQTFWGAFLRCFGMDVPHQHGVVFEHPARRASTGNIGAIDVFQPAIQGGEHSRDGFLIEQKSEGRVVTPSGAQRSNAEDQAQDYLDGGDIPVYQTPRWVITSDFKTIQITDLSKPARATGRTKTFPTRDLPHFVEDFLWLTGENVDELVATEQAEASVAAARLMANLYTTMTGDADTGDGTRTPAEEEQRTAETSVLLTRLLFLMFADDASMHRWRTGQFQRWLKNRTRSDGSDLGGQLATLFKALNTPENRRSDNLDEALTAFPYVNGDLFATRLDPEDFNSEMRDALLKACEFDWSRISPAVFGSLFQTVKSREARHAAGEHYTSEENILKTLRPLFLDDLHRRIDAAKSAPQLEAIHNEMRSMRFVDPACGCGNFLVVAYREMRALELDLLIRLRDRRGESGQTVLDAAELLNVTLDQFVGIELNWWPAKIAQTAMFLVDHQANQAMTHALGGAPDRLPINIAATIHHTNALTSDWEELLPEPGPVTYVFGNPPFLGRAQTTATQKAELREAWGTQNVGHLDFVTAWHAKTLTYMDNRKGEWAYVTTNSITQGEPVEPLFRAVDEAGWHIKFAHRTFKWTSESRSDERAAVHVVIVGFTRDHGNKPRLFTYKTPTTPPVEVKVTHRINGYLIDAENLFVVSRSTPLSPGLPPISFGSMPRDGGHLVVKASDHDMVASDPVAAKYLRRYVGGQELIHNEDRWCLWLTDLDPSDVNRSPVLKERLRATAEVRAASTADTTRAAAQTPHLFVQNGQPTASYLCIPRVFSEDRIFMTANRFETDVIASDQTFTAVDPDGFAFAVISSTMFLTWQRIVGGCLESRLRFAKTLVWNTFPMPEIDETTRKAIIAAGDGVLKARALYPARSLAEHYQPLGMRKELVNAHRALDKAIDKAFGADARTRLDEAKRMKMLFEHYASLTESRA